MSPWRPLAAANAPRNAPPGAGDGRASVGWRELGWPRPTAPGTGRTVICELLLGSEVEVYTAPVGRRRRDPWSRRGEVSRRR